MQRVSADLVYDLRQLALEFNDPFLPHSHALSQLSVQLRNRSLLPISNAFFNLR